MPEEFRKRIPSKERKIEDIQPEDVRVRITGTVIDKNENTLVVDDGTGKINATFEEEPDAEKGQLVRVFGRIVPIEDGFEIQGELAQDMSSLDLELKKKVEKALGR